MGRGPERGGGDTVSASSSIMLEALRRRCHGQRLDEPVGSLGGVTMYHSWWTAEPTRNRRMPTQYPAHPLMRGLGIY